MLLFAEVAECGSFTQAGLQLEMPKSTLSQRLSKLEEQLGLRLLNRSTRSVGLTANGQVYLEHCRRVRTETISASVAMSNLRDQPVGRLRLICPEITATYFMPDFVSGFSERFPKIEIELLATNTYVDLVQDRIDFALRVGTTRDTTSIVRKLSSLKRIFVASPG